MRTGSWLAAAALALGCGPAPSSAALPAVGAGAPRAAPSPGVLQHHGDPSRAGIYADPAFTRAAVAGLHADPAFRAAVPGAIYAQPLAVPAGPGGRDLLIVATEQDVVAALDPATGQPVWTRRLGAPVPLSALPCGNIDPLGVTGTPIVDPASRTLFLDAMVTPDGGRSKQHLVFALGVDDGAPRPGWPVDVAAALAHRGQRFEPAAQNERGALAIAAGTLYVPFGGHYGDCGDYRGTLLAIPLGRPQDATAWRAGARGGGMWGPSGVASDGARVFVTTGNTFDAPRWAGGEAVLGFPAGAPLGAAAPDFFAPANWQDLDQGDTDLGGAGPVLLDLPGSNPASLAVALGKDGNLYLADRTRLGGLGGAVTVAQVAQSAIITAGAVYSGPQGAVVVFRGQGRGCPAEQGGDLTAVRITPGAPPTASVAWCARQDGRGSPMVTTTDGRAESVVWSVGAEGDGRLHGFDGDTGRELVSVPVDGTVRRFQAPVLWGGRIYVAVDGGVRAFTR